MFLPECSEESAELINALLGISNPCVLSLGLDCLYKWTPKANLECFEAAFNERFQAVFHDFISSQQKNFINPALFVADSAMKRSPECFEFFIASGIAELAPFILSLSDDEIVLFLSSICSISEVYSDITNEFIKMEGLEAIMNEVVENYSYSVFQYVFIFIINFCKRNNEEAFIFVLDNYANVLAKMIEVLNNGKCFIATNILNTYYLILDWIFSKRTSGKIYFGMLNIEGLSEAIDGLLKTEVSPEVEELANEIREKLQ